MAHDLNREDAEARLWKAIDDTRIGMLGVVGGGGIGDFAMRYGYQEYNDALMYLTIFIIFVCVLAMQAVGYRTSQRLDHR